jgi:RNA-directed DNA polymerase
MTDDHGKSDSPILPEKSPNKVDGQAAEGMEGRGLVEGNLLEQNAPRTQSRRGVPSALERVCEAENYSVSALSPEAGAV